MLASCKSLFARRCEKSEILTYQGHLVRSVRRISILRDCWCIFRTIFYNGLIGVVDSFESKPECLGIYIAQVGGNMNKLLRTLSLLITSLIIFSVFSIAIGAAEPDSSSLLGNENVRRPSEAGALQVIEIDGQMTLADENSKPIQLRGMSTHGLQWFGEIVNENSFATLSSDWDSNVIRLALYIGENGYSKDPALKELVYKGIDLAFKNDMYVIVDWHVLAPGDPNEAVYAGAKDFFAEIADHYKNDPKYFSIIWEICNEPSPNNSGGNGLTNDAAGWQAVKKYAEPIVEMLRTKGDNIIIVGNPNWSQRPDLAADDPINADNIMYAVHFYSGTHMSSADSKDRSNVMANARYALENGVAIFVSEWGTSEASGNNGPFLDESDVWIEFMNSNNISWCNWSLTNKNETSGSFIPYMMGISEATLLDPGDDLIWAPEELSVSGEYARARIKGIELDPIDRSAEGAFSEVIWNFDDGTTQGFVINKDSPLTSVTLSNQDGCLLVSNLVKSIDVTDTNYWANVRISSEEYNPSFDISGADTITMDVFIDEPTTVSIACVPQSDTHGWANPKTAVRLNADNFKKQEDGKYKAQLVTTAVEAPNLATIADDEKGSVLTNLVLFVGSENGADVRIDNITFSGAGESALPPLEHAEKGTATLPSDFDDNTRQGWDWSVDSGTKVSIKVEEANSSKALAFEFAYPEVKPTDNWASAPRLDLWIDPLTRGSNDFVVFDLYLSPTQASKGAISISGAFQPPDVGYWAQMPVSFDIKLDELGKAKKTKDGLYHYLVKLDIRGITSIEDDTVLRNMIFIIADVESDFAGKIYVDNIRLMTKKDVEALDQKPIALIVAIVGGAGVAIGAGAFAISKKKNSKPVTNKDSAK